MKSSITVVCNVEQDIVNNIAFYVSLDYACFRFNHIALRKAKIVYKLGLSLCSRVKNIVRPELFILLFCACVHVCVLSFPPIFFYPV